MGLYDALGGGQPPQVPQQAAPSPAPSGAPGGGSFFQALAQSPMAQGGAQPGQLGPKVADNTGLMQGNPFFQKASSAKSDASPTPPPPPPPSDDPSLAKTATDFFNRMKK